jgi:hypothetical protein
MSHDNRIDTNGYSVKVTRLQRGYGIRVFHHGELVASTSCKTKDEIGASVADVLRMIDKVGNPSEMASASRARRSRKNRPAVSTKITWCTNDPD